MKPRSTTSQTEAINDVTALLRARRGIRPATANNFAVVTSDRLLEVYNGFFGVFFLVMVALSGVGLMVGGVGVVAIMMISVTERTREIGVRKALGATRRIILWQFLVEAATLTSIGAVAGLVAGGVLAQLVDHFTPIPASIPPARRRGAGGERRYRDPLRDDARGSCCAPRSRRSASVRVAGARRAAGERRARKRQLCVRHLDLGSPNYIFAVGSHWLILQTCVSFL